MPPSEPLVFSNVSPEQYAALVQKANQAGIKLTGNAGTTSQFGVEVSWNYSPEARQLAIQVLNTPFFMTADAVNNRIKTLVHESAG
jgi:hypothetical protein